MNILGGKFFQLSNAVFCYGLKPIHLTVYSYLVSCAGQKEKCWPAMKTIATLCGCSENAARDAVKELEYRGFIRRVSTFANDRSGRKWQTNNTYYILPLPPLSHHPQVVYQEDTANGGEINQQG